MTRRLPPLNALRTFEAAARHLSFAKAAEELSVTSAAVSHQIKLLEGILGTRLFTRGKHAVQLTDSARICLPYLSDGFDRLAAAVELLHRLDDAGRLRVSVAGSFAAKWLLPRLARFHAAHPSIDVELVACDEPVTAGVDAAILYGDGAPTGFHADPLLGERLVAVCAPALLAGRPRPVTPPDLAAFTLLHDGEPPEEECCPGWAHWCAAFGLTGIDTRRGIRFNRSALAVDAAIAGQGMALTRQTIAAEALAGGQLVAPFGPGVPSRRMHRFVCPSALAHHPRVRAFARWLRREATLDTAAFPVPAGPVPAGPLQAGPVHSGPLQPRVALPNGLPN